MPAVPLLHAIAPAIRAEEKRQAREEKLKKTEQAGKGARVGEKQKAGAVEDGSGMSACSGTDVGPRQSPMDGSKKSGGERDMEDEMPKKGAMVCAKEVPEGLNNKFQKVARSAPKKQKKVQQLQHRAFEWSLRESCCTMVMESLELPDQPPRG